jgi:hypothetical protein
MTKQGAAAAKEAPERVRNTLATPDFLRAIATCCVCDRPIQPRYRYLCPPCAKTGRDRAAKALNRDRILRAARLDFAEADCAKGLR